MRVHSGCNDPCLRLPLRGQRRDGQLESDAPSSRLIPGLSNPEDTCRLATRLSQSMDDVNRPLPGPAGSLSPNGQAVSPSGIASVCGPGLAGGRQMAPERGSGPGCGRIALSNPGRDAGIWKNR